eukprot:Em0014g719a
MDSERCIRNALGYAYSALRLRDRFLSPNDIKSAYEDYCGRLSNLLNASGALDIRNAEVEAFYTGKVNEEDFSSMLITKLVSKRRNGIGLTPLFALTWEFYSPIVTAAENVAEIHEVSLRHLWEIFIKLDMEGDTTLSVDDIVALVLTIFHANGLHRSEAEIGEWFYPHTLVNYIGFISALSNRYAKYLKPVIVHHLHEIITTEVLRKGRLTKKGHRMPSWKERFFVLKPSSIDYYMEGEDDGKKEQKGTILLTPRSQVYLIPGTKNFIYVFRVDGDSTTVSTDIAAPDMKVMREWVEAIKLAIKMNDLIATGLNILQCYHKAQKELSPNYDDVTPSEEVATPPTPNYTPSLQPADVPQPVPLRFPGRPLPNPMAPSSSAPVPAKRTRPQSMVISSPEKRSDSPTQPPPPVPYSSTRPQPPPTPVKASPSPPSSGHIVTLATDDAGSGDGVVVHRPQRIFVGRGDDYALIDKLEGTKGPQPSTPPPNPPEVTPRAPKPRKNKPSAAAGEREERRGEEEEEEKMMKGTTSDSALVVPPPRGVSALPRTPKPYSEVNGTSYQTSTNPAVPVAPPSNPAVPVAPPSNPGVPVVPPRLSKTKMS